MDDLLLHPATRSQLQKSLSGNHHALALIGPAGAGKSFLAEVIAKNLLKKVNEHSLHSVRPINNSIGIDEIRGLQTFLRLRSIGSDTVRRVVIIEDAHLLTIEAQNALLKILEEPPIDVRLVLTINGAERLKPTVYSRLQQIYIKPVPQSEAVEYFMRAGFEKEAINKAYLISNGSAGLCSALLNDLQHPLTEAIKEAKSFLLASPYEKLVRVDVLAKDKEDIDTFLLALKRILTAAVRQNSQKTAVKRLRAVHQAEAALPANPNLKLLLSDLALHL